MIGETIIKRLELLGELAPGDREALLSLRGEVREVDRGEDLLKDGGPAAFSVVVLAGLVQRYRYTAEGARQIQSFYLPGDIPCFETLPLDYMDNNLGGAGSSRVGIVPREEIWRVVMAQPNVLALVWRETIVQAAIFREWLMRNSKLLAHTRMANFFCEMHARARAAGLTVGGSFELPITQADLADALGMAPIHAGMTLKILGAAQLLDFEGEG